MALKELTHRAAPARWWRVMLAGVVLSTVVALSSCATIGREFPVSRVPEIRMGETSDREVQAMFGPPWRVGVEDGRRTWTYGRYRYRLFGRARTEDLVLRFDDHGKVVSYTFNTTEHDK